MERDRLGIFAKVHPIIAPPLLEGKGLLGGATNVCVREKVADKVKKEEEGT